MRKSILIAVLVLGLGVGLFSGPGVQGDEEQEPYVTVANVTGIVTFWGLALKVSYVSGAEFPERVDKIEPYLIEFEAEGFGRDPHAIAYTWDLLFGRTVWLVHYGVVNRDMSSQLRALVYLDSAMTTLYQAIMVSQGLARAEDLYAYPRTQLIEQTLDLLEQL